MDPNDISLDSINKLFEYEKQSRIIDTLNLEESRRFAKLYCKLYLKQQDIFSNMINHK